MDKSKNYKKAINELTKLQTEGNNFRDNMIKEYLVSFSGNLYVILNTVKIKYFYNYWKAKVIKKLNKFVPNSRYISYFKHPKYHQSNIPGIDSVIINSYHSRFLSHFNALNAIIWNIKEDEIKLIKRSILLITLDLNKATLKYRNNKPITISPNKQSIKLLKILLDNQENIVEYHNIAKYLNINSYYEGIQNKDISREINYIRKGLVEELKKAGMNRNEINKYIITVKGIGYKATLTT